LSINKFIGEQQMILDMSFEQRSLLFAKLSSIAYSDDTKQVKKDARTLGFTTIEFYNRDGAQAYRFMNKHDIVIACRGTQPSEFNDIKADLKAAPVIADTVGRVHRGFKAEVDELWKLIEEDLCECGKKRTAWFTGHSLGAAMTTIMASRAEDDSRMPHIEEVYTYGSPRVGWRKFVNALNCKHQRWVNNNDIVTRVPMAAMGYVHDGCEHYMDSNGDYRPKLRGLRRAKDRWRGMWLGLTKGSVDNFSDHSMDNYITNLEKLQ
jgi:triacylglycerol lipase